MKNLKLALAIAGLALLSQSALAQIVPSSLILQNDIVVGSKTYVRYDDLQRLGITIPSDTIDDEGYCVVDDTFLKGNDGFDQYSRPRALPRGTVLQVLDVASHDRTTMEGKVVTDQWVLVTSPRGLLQIGCSIDSGASETVPYTFNLRYLKAIGITTP